MLSQFWDQQTVSDREKKLVLLYGYTHLRPRVCLKWRVCMRHWKTSFSEDVPLVGCMYPVFTCKPGKVNQVSVTVVSLVCWALLTSFCLWIFHTATPLHSLLHWRDKAGFNAFVHKATILYHVLVEEMKDSILLSTRLWSITVFFLKRWRKRIHCFVHKATILHCVFVEETKEKDSMPLFTWLQSFIVFLLKRQGSDAFFHTETLLHWILYWRDKGKGRDSGEGFNTFVHMTASHHCVLIEEMKEKEWVYASVHGGTSFHSVPVEQMKEKRQYLHARGC